MAYVEVRFLVDGQLVWNQGREVTDLELGAISRDVANSLGTKEFLPPARRVRRTPVDVEVAANQPELVRGRYKAVLAELIAERPGESLDREQALALYLARTGGGELNAMQRKGFNNAWRVLMG